MRPLYICQPIRESDAKQFSLWIKKPPKEKTMISFSSPAGHAKAIKRYEDHKEVLRNSVSYGLDVFALPLHAGGRFYKDAQMTPNPIMKFAAGTAAVVVPVALVPFSTIASAAVFAVMMPPSAIRIGVDRLRLLDREI
jgi:hypothetical protein